MIRALVLQKRGSLAYIQKETPALNDAHGVLLRPLLVSPCTSDVHTIWMGSPKRPDLTLGHECVAEVAETGPEVRDFHRGDVVAVPAITPDWDSPEVDRNPAHAGGNFSAHMLGKSIDGAFQELFYLPHADLNLAHVPEGVSLHQALMCVDAVTTGFTAAEEAGVAPGSSVVVMGVGAIGLCAVMAARHYGAARVFAVGSRPENMALACEYGATALNYKTLRCDLPEGLHPLANSTGSSVVNHVLRETGNRGVDAVLICGGNDLALAQAVDMVKYGTGVVSNVMYYGAADGCHENNIDAIQIPKFSIGRGMAGKTLKFSLAKGGRARMEYLLELCRQRHIFPERLITREYSGLDRIEQAIYDMRDRKAIKIAIHIS